MNSWFVQLQYIRKHMPLAIFTHPTKLQVLEVLDRFVKGLWVSSIEKKATHPIPPHGSPILTASFVVAATISMYDGGELHSDSPCVLI